VAGFHQHDDVQTARPHPVEPYPKEPIDRAESGTAGPLATEDRELVAERNDLELQFHAAAKPTS
jgi:hypothetical protein